MSTANPLAWRKSSYSSNGEGCVDVAPADTGVYVRHTKHHDHGTITFTHDQWTRMLDRIRGNDATENTSGPSLHKRGTDTILTSDDVTLRFDTIEWRAFTAGVADGEFDFHPEPADHR